MALLFFIQTLSLINKRFKGILKLFFKIEIFNPENAGLVSPTRSPEVVRTQPAKN
jgi:hypothetical protein